MEKVSFHAAERMMERGASVDVVKDVLTNASISYPGNKLGTECIQKGNWRMVVSHTGTLISAVDLSTEEQNET